MGQAQSQVAWEPTGAHAVIARIRRLSIVALLVDHRCTEFAVVRPRATVHVVTAHAGPHVVDGAHLGVHVDGGAHGVLEVEHMHAVGTGLAADFERLQLPDAVGEHG